jgi:hypothetical protein
MDDKTVVERDFEEVAAEAYAEADNAAKGEITEPKVKESTPKKDDTEAGQTDDKADEQTESVEGVGEGAEGKKEEGDASEKSVDMDKKITEHAEKHKMTYVEAKEDIEKTEEIIKQYKNDPSEMARAMRNKDREYSKLRSEAEKAAKKTEPVFQRMSEDQFREFAKKQLADKPDYIEKYRAKYPAKSESMSDEAIIEEISDREYLIYNEKAAQKEGEIKDTARARREELIASIPEADRKFIPEIKAILLEANDAAVIREGFDIKDALYWAKGKSYDADIKAAEERALKRFKESPEIVGTKGSGSSKPQSSGSVGLNDNQRLIATDMFGADYDDAKCYEMFKETYKDELKKNPKFDPNKD